MPRYRFADFALSPRRRLLFRGDRELPLIPRYFDLLVFLVERRHEAVHRRDIFDRVWSDVIVSDSALSQAIRTLRRTLGDDPREPRFIRTVSRHGYRFAFPDVIEEEDDEGWPPREGGEVREANESSPPEDPFEPLLDRIARPADTGEDEEERREAAELLHALGTAEALRRLGTRPGHARARAVLRDARWEAPAAADVPVLGGPAPFSVARELAAARIRQAARDVAGRAAGASVGGGLAGVAAGAAGALILIAAPDNTAPAAVVPVLAIAGAACGAIAGAGVGAGISAAEATIRSRRSVALVCGAAAGGALAGGVAQLLTRWSLAALVGLTPPLGGALEGLLIGGAAGLGYAIVTRHVRGGLAAPRGRRRLHAALLSAGLCGLAALILTVLHRPLVGGTLHTIAREAQGAQVTLAPLGRLLGEPDFGPLSQALIGTGEGAIFGLGVMLGLLRRPSSRRSQDSMTVP